VKLISSNLLPTSILVIVGADGVVAGVVAIEDEEAPGPLLLNARKTM
jgi:hypothetical protein